ncbi:nuclear envelope integral membrane protein isoform X1 [Megalopta genalis]|uniref:nuclear envelope integral membrane protein isoform X1 n=2 Tax=Megalopta genalis TaxID=115081 RepID=UPI003FD59287
MCLKTVQLLSVIVSLLVCSYPCTESASTDDSIHFLNVDDVFEIDKPELQIFCHRANTKYLIHIWKSLTMHLSTNLDNYDLYDGTTPAEVIEKHEDNKRSWRFNLFGTKKSNKLKLNPFEDTCIGVYAQPSKMKKYMISVTQTRLDSLKLSLMVLGIITFCSARKLSDNPLFYYLCGVALGITTSAIILVYLVSKLLPKGKAMYVMIATGWTMSFYLIQALWENAQLIVIQYREWLTWYILATSLISLVICYRFGPVTNRKTKKLIEWFLQIVGLITMYYSSYFREASFFCCVLIVLLYHFPVAIVRKGRSYWKTMFPEKRKLLTDDQYRKEGVIETKKALTELREYCSSPECNTWKTVLRLKDPLRFAKFMEGESHLSDEESREHDAEITRLIDQCEYTDDEEDC